MKMKSAIFAWMTLMLLNGCGLITPGQKKSVSESQKERPVVHVPLADPFILLHDGTYYAYGTKAEHGIAVFESDDLQTWRQASGRAAEGLALHKDDVYGDRWFWAPEVYCINGAFYMFFSAQSHVCVAVSDSPLGPFVQKEKKPMIEGEKCIDNTLFIDLTTVSISGCVNSKMICSGLNPGPCKNVSMFPRNGRPCGRG